MLLRLLTFGLYLTLRNRYRCIRHLIYCVPRYLNHRNYSVPSINLNIGRNIPLIRIRARRHTTSIYVLYSNKYNTITTFSKTYKYNSIRFIPRVTSFLRFLLRLIRFLRKRSFRICESISISIYCVLGSFLGLRDVVRVRHYRFNYLFLLRNFSVSSILFYRVWFFDILIFRPNSFGLMFLFYRLCTIFSTLRFGLKRPNLILAIRYLRRSIMIRSNDRRNILLILRFLLLIVVPIVLGNSAIFISKLSCFFTFFGRSLRIFEVEDT